MSATVYRCASNHMTLSPTPITECKHMVQGKPCPAPIEATTVKAARFLTDKAVG